MSLQLQRWHLLASLIPASAAVFYLCTLLIAYGQLPQDMPVKFDFSGEATDWMNKAIWLVLSPLVLAAAVVLAFSTRPTPLGVNVIVYWSVCGLLIGAFLQTNRSAVKRRSFHYLPVLVWVAAVPICEIILVKVLTGWWRGSS